MSGYIKLYRSVRGTAIAQHPEYFCAWVHLLLMASHKAHQQVVGKKVVHLAPGQLIFGRQKFSANTGISENKVRAAITVLKQLGMITSKPHAKFSVITITKWNHYQGESPANNHKRTSTAPAPHHKQECIKNEQENTPLPPKGDVSENFCRSVLNCYRRHMTENPQSVNVTKPRLRKLAKLYGRTVSAPSTSGAVEVRTDTVEFWDRYFQRAASQPFLTGESPDGWQATFDWLITESNFYKVLENHYAGAHDD